MLQDKRLILACLALTSAASMSSAQEGPLSEMRMMGECSDCVLHEKDYSEARLSGIALENSEITEVSFNHANLSLSVFDGARLTDVSFDGTNLRGASFVGTVLVNVNFDDADLMGAVFEGATLDQTDLSRGRLCKTQLPDDTMANDGCN